MQTRWSTGADICVLLTPTARGRGQTRQPVFTCLGKNKGRLSEQEQEQGTTVKPLLAANYCPSHYARVSQRRGNQSQHLSA